MTDAITPKVSSIENMLKRTIEKTHGSSHPACPTCHIKIWISLFFDGTGNHKERDTPLKCHSNVAALFDAHVDERENGIIRRYYEGLGRPFKFKDRYEEVHGRGRNAGATNVKVGYEEKSDSLLGKGFAAGIQERIEKALYDFTIEVEDWKKSRRVDEINLAIFGFSRGATEARAFLHWLKSYSKIKDEGNRLSYDGIPLNVKFLGIFDTVESVGNAGTNLETDLIKTQIPKFVEKCTHIVAAHELRHAFPLTVGDGSARHVVYPGAHSDIGGGYKPNEQGRTNQLARVALLQMLDEARAAGLKMMSLGEMKANGDDWDRIFRSSFDVPSEVSAALNNYIAEINPSGSVPQHFEAHMKAYWAWIDSGQAMADVDNKRASFKDTENRKAFMTMYTILNGLARTASGRSGTKITNAVSNPISHMLSEYVHDSFEHFSATGGTIQTDLSNADYYHTRTINQPS